MEDVNISKFRAQVVRSGSTPASPGFVVSEGQNPVDPSGSSQNHLPVTIATAATGLSITESQILSGAGTVGQYIRGDGSLADFPATTGGGSSVSYYLNGSVSQGTIGGVAYRELNRTPIFGAGTDISISSDGYIANFITDAGDPNKLEIPAGNWNLETYFSASSSGGTPSFYVELYKYDGTTFTLIASSSSSPELIAFGTNLNPYFSTLAVPQTTLALTDRLALRYYVNTSGRTITLHTENNHLCQVITTFTTGLTALNGLTSQVQFFAVGTSGTDFAISSATDTHTFNLPTASATNRGALSSADWTTFNNKTSNLGTVTSVGLSSATSGVTIGSTPITTSGTITLAIATASGSQNGLLSSTDWTTFNGKQNALTNPVTGTGTSGTIPVFTGSTTIGNSIIQSNSTQVNIVGNGSQLLFDSLGQVKTGGIQYTNSFDLLINNSRGSGSSIILGNINIDFNTNVSGNPRVRITDAGNVGINTTTPATTLEVNGVGLFSGTSLAGNTKNGVYILDQSILSLAGGNARPLNIQSQTLSIFTGISYSEKLKVFENGNVVISTSPSDNGAKLQVSGVIKGTFNSVSFQGPNNHGFEFVNATTTTKALIGGYDSTYGAYIQGVNFGVSYENLLLNPYGGNVGIGTTSPSGRLHIVNSSGGFTPSNYLQIEGSIANNNNYPGISLKGGTLATTYPSITLTNGGLALVISNGIATAYNNPAQISLNNGNIGFSTGDNSAATQRMLITLSGYSKHSNSGSFWSSTSPYHEFGTNTTANWNSIFFNTSASPFGIYMPYTGGSPNGSGNQYLYFTDSSALRFEVRSNGGIGNFQANNVNLSDERTKKDIEPLESYWDKFKAIEIVKFKYKDQTHDDFNIGVIAQQVEKVAPEFVDVDGWDNKLDENKNEIEEEPMKSIYTADLHHATIKVLQEAMAKIEAMQKEIDTLKNL